MTKNGVDKLNKARGTLSKSTKSLRSSGTRRHSLRTGTNSRSRKSVREDFENMDLYELENLIHQSENEIKAA